MLEHYAKRLSIYANSQKIYICSNQIFKKNYASIQKGPVTELSSSVTEEELQAAIFESLKNCNLELLEEMPELSSLEEHLGVKGYDKAILHFKSEPLKEP
ncbi:hypothetical protein [Paenibacillus faecalis]|uniref:hypothetical protein n=1 Tax=Paenibacillus faecalis TaxID=2079532 RepID=UPI000D0F85F7|nr:hypothetical protein [Paenibacillus faecalis]